MKKHLVGCERGCNKTTHLCGDYFIDHDKHHPFSIQVNIESSHRILWLYQSHDIRIPWLNNRYFMESIQPPVVFVTFRWRFWRMLSKGGEPFRLGCRPKWDFRHITFQSTIQLSPGNFQHVASKFDRKFCKFMTRLEGFFDFDVSTPYPNLDPATNRQKKSTWKMDGWLEDDCKVFMFGGISFSGANC